MGRRRKPESEPDPIIKMAVDLARAVAERSQMNKELLIGLTESMAWDKKTELRFITVVLTRLAKIETALMMIHGAQLVDSQPSGARWKEGFAERAKAAQEFIELQSAELGRQFFEVVYGETEAPGAEAKTPETVRKRKAAKDKTQGIDGK